MVKKIEFIKKSVPFIQEAEKYQDQINVQYSAKKELQAKSNKIRQDM